MPPPTSTRARSLTRLCVGRDEDRPLRPLAWAGSVCALFLAVGMAGFWLPVFRAAPPKLRKEIVPVVFIAPAPAAASKTFSTATSVGEPEITARTPAVANVANIPGPVAFAVPLETSALLTAAPVALPQAAVSPAFTQFKPATGTNAMPQPAYPDIARRRGYQGKVVVHFTVAASGEVLKAEVGRSSGFNVLDEAAIEAVRSHKGFEPGEVRQHFVEINFQLK